LNDESEPDDIKEQLHMSKKSFKKAIGGLFKDKKIRITEKGIELIK
jgi:predicted RNA-binding protein (virulence factor B family)